MQIRHPVLFLPKGPIEFVEKPTYYFIIDAIIRGHEIEECFIVCFGGILKKMANQCKEIKALKGFAIAESEEEMNHESFWSHRY